LQFKPFTLSNRRLVAKASGDGNKQVWEIHEIGNHQYSESFCHSARVQSKKVIGWSTPSNKLYETLPGYQVIERWEQDPLSI
jgi:hypothetical protein